MIYIYHKCLTDRSHLELVFPEPNAAKDLLIDEVRADWIRSAVVPGCEDLLAEEQAPGGVPLLPALPLHVLLALRDGIQDVISTTPEGGDLVAGGGRDREWFRILYKV